MSWQHNDTLNSQKPNWNCFSYWMHYNQNLFRVLQLH